jgi:hypothetical protein
MKKIWVFLLAAGILSLGLAATAQAGIYYEARTTVDGQVGDSLVHAWIDDENARIEFIESTIPTTKAGTYLVTRDAGRTLYLVNPKEETYSEWNLAAMMNLVEGMSGLVNLEFSEPQIQLLEERDGGTVAGHSTHYTKYRTTYDLQMKILGMKRAMATDTVQEMWTTDDLEQPALGVWLRKGGRSSGDSSLDRMIAAEMSKVTGFPLKTIAVSTTTSGKKGKPTTTTSTTEVTTLREQAVDADRFEIPANYQRVELFPAAGEDEEGNPGGNPFKSIFGKKNR